MDRTEVYIKMCDCPEIQEGHEWEDGDIFVQIYKNGEQGWPEIRYQVQDDPWYGNDPIVDKERKMRAIWLPRQDQIQEMLQPCGFGILLWDFHACASILIRDENITSMEQLWLAFYMKEKHNKVWNGDKWI